MEELLSNLKGSYFLVLILVLLTVLLTALYDNVLQKEFSIDVYFTYAGLVAFVSTIVVYINTLPQAIMTEEILKGPPDF